MRVRPVKSGVVRYWLKEVTHIVMRINNELGIMVIVDRSWFLLSYIFTNMFECEYAIRCGCEATWTNSIVLSVSEEERVAGRGTHVV